jgi:GNAT superfamily N-acetyltransferase
MKLALVTHAEHPELRDTMPDVWPEFMRHDLVVSTFWPRLYEVYPDFQLWAVDRDERATAAYACTLPVHWDGIPEPRGVDWAMSNGVTGEPSTLCAIVAGVAPEYRGTGLSSAILRRMTQLAAAHGLDCLIAPVRPTWKERYPLTPMASYLRWRREDGFLYDPWLRTHERVGAEVLEEAPRSLTVSGSREEWEEWTGLQFPEDGDYVVPGGLVPVRFEERHGTYVEPNVWMRHPLPLD